MLVALQRYLLLAAALAVLASGSPLPEPANEVSYRLPGDVLPVHYHLTIWPDYPTEGLFGIESFKGTLVISAVVGEDIDEIVLHKGNPIVKISVDCIQEVVPTSEDSPSVVMHQPATRYRRGGFDGARNSARDECLNYGEPDWDATTEKFVIPLENTITKDTNIEIVLSYEADFPSGSLTGFYVSNYTSDGKEAAVLATKFQPTYARQAFPCFDEPAFKATFDLIVNVKAGIEVIANTVEERRDGDLVTFKTSPRMSTYLLAFMVYDTDTFGRVDDNEDVPFRTWARKEAIENDRGTLSQTDGPAMLKFMEEYTKILYTESSITKMDQVAMPDFQSSAMENWGLVKYRENALLFNDEQDTTAAHWRVSVIIAHELAHQWFGNLVTTHWWNTTWLNEGFANYFEFAIMDHVYPEWRIAERMVLEDQMVVFEADAAAGVVAMTIGGVNAPAEIFNHFGTITYNKGGVILRQITNVMGEVNFQNGLSDFLGDRKFDDAVPEDLFRNLVGNNVQEVTRRTNEQLDAALQSWTTTPGYPVLMAERTSPTTYSVSQTRFLLSPDPTRNEKYPVALTWVSSRDPTPQRPLTPMAWLTSDDDNIVINVEGINSDDWVFFNAYQSGYYRVNYDDASWDQLQRTLRAAASTGQWPLAPVDRAALLDNALALARAGIVTHTRAFCQAAILRDDWDFAPWATARNALAPYQRLLGAHHQYKEFISFIVSNVYTSNGYSSVNSDNNFQLTHRLNVLAMACSTGHEDCIAESKKLLEQYLDNIDDETTRVHPDLQAVVYCYGLKGDDGTLWNKLWEEYLKAHNDAGRRGVLTTALGCTDHKDSLTRYLTNSLDNSLVRGQEAFSVFTAVTANPDGLDVVLQFFEDTDYDELEKAYGQVRNVMLTIVNGMANRITREDQLVQLERGLDDKASLHQGGLNTAKANMAWVMEHGEHILHDFEAAVRCGAATPAAFAAVVALALAALLLTRR